MIHLEINGQPLEMFKNVEVSRSYQSVPAEFSFTATVSPSDLTQFPVTIGDACKVIVKGEVFVSGFVDEITPRHNKDTHEISVRGASKVVDLVESCIDGSYDIHGPQTLKEALESIIFKSGVDVAVIDTTETPATFDEGEVIAGDIGYSAWSLMLQCAIKKNVLLTENANGDVVITSAAGTKINTTLIKEENGAKNNIMGSNMRLSHAQRYHTYTAISQDGSSAMSFNLLGEEDPSEGDSTGSDNRGTAFDGEIRQSRKKAFITEQSSDHAQCLERAVWQANYQRVQSFEYNCTVQGFFYTTGEMIDCGHVVNVKDVYMSVESDLIIDTVTFTYTQRGGSLTRLKMLLPDAFTLEASEPKFEDTGNDMGGLFL